MPKTIKPINPLLGTYLANQVKAGVIDFHLRARIDEQGAVLFYIHPAHQSGETADFYTRPDRPDVMNVRGMDAILEAAMNPRRKFGISGSDSVR